MRLFLIFTPMLMLVGLFYVYGGAQYMNIAALDGLLQAWRAGAVNDLWGYGLVTALIYIALMSTPLPITAISILSAGYLFGLGAGVPIVLFSSLVAATVTCVLCRYVLADFVKKKAGSSLGSLFAEIETAGFWYSLSLRLSAVVPFFLLNCAQAITPIKIREFMLATFLGMIPVTFVLVNAGTRLAEIDHIKDVLDTKVMLSFMLVALLPVMIRFTLAATGIGSRKSQQ